MWKLGALWPIYLQFPLNQLFGRHWFDIVSEIYWWDLCCGAVLWFQCALCSLAVLISMIPPKSYEEVMTVFHEFPSVDPVVLYDSRQHPDSPCVNRDSVPRIRGRHERWARLVTLQHDDLHVQKSLVENSWLGVCQKLHPRKDVHAVPRLAPLPWWRQLAGIWAGTPIFVMSVDSDYLLWLENLIKIEIQKSIILENSISS